MISKRSNKKRKIAKIGQWKTQPKSNTPRTTRPLPIVPLKKKIPHLRTMNNEVAPSLFDDEDDLLPPRKQKSSVLKTRAAYPSGLLPDASFEGKATVRRQIKDFILTSKHNPMLNTLILWSEQPGTGKTTMCWNAFKQLGIMPHTLDAVTMEDTVPVEIGIQRILNAQEKGHIYFFLDDLGSACQTRDKITKLVDMLSGRQNLTCVICVDNLYENYLYPLRATSVGNKKTSVALKSTPLRPAEMTRLLRKQWYAEQRYRKTNVLEKEKEKQAFFFGLGNTCAWASMKDWCDMGNLTASIESQAKELANGDARQAITFVKMHMGTTACSHARDIIVNPFEATRSAFRANGETWAKAYAQTMSCDVSLLKRFIQENYPRIVMPAEPSPWDTTRADVHAESRMCDLSSIASSLSDADLLTEDESKHLLFFASATTTSVNKNPTIRWPSYPYMKIRNTRNMINKFAHSVPCVVDDVIQPTSVPAIDVGFVFDLMQHHLMAWTKTGQKQVARKICEYEQDLKINTSVLIDRGKVLLNSPCAVCGTMTLDRYHCIECRCRMCKHCSNNVESPYPKSSRCTACRTRVLP